MSTLQHFYTSTFIVVPLLSLLMLMSCGRSYQTGDLYDKNGERGIIVDIDEPSGAMLLLSLEESDCLGADSALTWAGSCGEGWHLPSKSEMEKMRKYRSAINNTLERNKLPKILVGHTFYWTATECSPSHVYACGPNGLQCFFRTNSSPLYKARAVKQIINK